MEQSSAQLNHHHKPCLSVITTSNTSHSCSHVAQNLTAKPFNTLEEKNKAYQPFVSEEDEAPRSSASASTSAATPFDIISAQFKCESSAGLNSASRNEEETAILEDNGETEQAQPEGSDVLSAETVIANFINMNNEGSNTVSNSQSDNIPANNSETIQRGTPNVTAPTVNFTDGLEFIMDKTPVLSIFMSLICLSLMSGIAVSFLEGKYTHSYLFIILYVFLFYVLVGKVLKMIRANGSNTPTLSTLLKGEPLYNVLDITALIFITLLADLRVSGVISSLNLGLFSLIAVFTLYCICSRTPLKTKAYGIIKRLFPIVQLLAITYKLDNESSLSWNVVLCSGWVILGGFLFKLFEGIVRVLIAFQGENSLSVISRSSKSVSIAGLFLLMVDVVVLMLVLVGACKALDGEDSEMVSLTLWLTVAQYLNSALLFYSTITGADLLDFVLTATEYFTQAEKIAERLRQLVTSKQETYIRRVSPTYYKVVNKCAAEEEENTAEKEGCEENSCYICCSNEADGVILDCGHGGICHGCLIDYIGRKDGCMECRNKIQSVIKIEKEVISGKVYKGEQVTKIMRPVESN